MGKSNSYKQEVIKAELLCVAGYVLARWQGAYKQACPSLFILFFLIRNDL